MLKFFVICIALLSVCNVLVSGSSSSSLVDDIFSMNSRIQDNINSMIYSDLNSASTGIGTGSSSSLSSYTSSSGTSSSSGGVSTSTVTGTDSDGNSYTRVTKESNDGSNIYRTVTTTYPSGKTTTKKTTIKL